MEFKIIKCISRSGNNTLFERAQINYVFRQTRHNGFFLTVASLFFLLIGFSVRSRKKSNQKIVCIFLKYIPFESYCCIRIPRLSCLKHQIKHKAKINNLGKRNKNAKAEKENRAKQQNERTKKKQKEEITINFTKKKWKTERVRFACFRRCRWRGLFLRYEFGIQHKH